MGFPSTFPSTFPNGVGGASDFNRLTGIFIDTNEHLQLTDGTVPANKYKHIVVHWYIGPTALAAIKAAHPAAQIHAYQNVAAMIAGPHVSVGGIERPTTLVTQEEGWTHNTAADLALGNGFEEPTAGTTIASGQGPTGNEWDFNFLNGAGSTLTADTARVYKGSQSAKAVVTAGSTNALCRWASKIGSRSQLYHRVWVNQDFLPTGSGQVWLNNTSDTGSAVIGPAITPAGQLIIRNGLDTTTLKTFSTTIPVDAWFRLEWKVTAAGAYEVRLYLTPDGSTPTETQSGTDGTAQATLNSVSFCIDRASSGITGWTAWFDSPAVSSSTWLGTTSGVGDRNGTDNWFVHTESPAAATITSSTNVTPPVFTTSTAHGLSLTEASSGTRDWVEIRGHSISSYNGFWQVRSVPTTTTVTFENAAGTPMAAAGAGSGGTIRKVVRFCSFAFLHAANIDKASYRTQATNHLAQIATDGFDGVFLDDANMKPGHCFNEGEANDSVEFASNNDYRDAMRATIAALAPSLRAQGLTILPNIVGSDPWVVNEYAGVTGLFADGTVDGVYYEFYGNWWGAASPQVGEEWLNITKIQGDAEAAGVFFAGGRATLSPADDTRAIRYVNASFWMHWNGTADSGAAYFGGRPLSAYGQYRQLIGTPTETKQLVSGTASDTSPWGAWMRHYTGGVVCVNAKSTAGLVTFTLGGIYLDPSGASVTSVQLNSGNGMVLLATAGGGGTTSAIPTTIVEIAFATDPLSTSPIWTDVTDYVILQEGELQITRGASDEFSAMQPSILTLWLDNSDGRFTRGRVSSPYYPNVKNGKRIRVSLTFNSVVYRRFDGHINNWPTAWKVTGGVPYIPVQITAIDRFDRLNKRGELRSVIEEEYLRDITGAELLLGTDGTFETSLGNWAIGGGISTAVASTEQSRTGSYSMKLTADGTGAMFTKNDGNSAAGSARVFPGERISISAWLRPSTTVRTWRTVLRYGDTAGAYVTQDNGPAVTEVASTWTYVSYSSTVPSGVGTVYAQVETTVTPTNGENHYVDDASIIIGSRPSAYYPLSEASGSTSAANIGPYSQGVVSVTTFTGEGDIDFGSGTGPGTDELSAPSFLPTSPTNGGKYLSGELLTPVGGNRGFTLEAFLRAPRATNTRDIVALETSLGRRAELSFNASGQLIGFTTAPNGVKNYTLTSSSIVNDNSTHHVALTEQQIGGVIRARLYRDGVQVGTTAYSDTAIEQYRAIYIGGEPVFGQLFEGTISHVGAYSTPLPATRIASHSNAGKTSLIERTDQRIARIADWIGIPVTDRNLDIGDTMVGWQGTSGQQAITAMQEAEATEGPGSALFMSGANKLTFHSQVRRANSTVFLTLDATDAAQIGTELEFPGDDFGLFNDVTIERPREGQARWLNQTSIDTYGLYRTSISTIHAFDVDALAAAQWIAESYGTPKNRTPNITCDLFVLASRGTATTLVETILQTEISKKLRLINLPPEAPVATLDQFVEGTVETIGIAAWTIQFLCSPGDFANVWQLGITGYSELGLTTTLGL